jgi:hypothetical protein
MTKSSLCATLWLLAVCVAQAQALTCASKIGGTWNFGSVPDACSVSPLQAQSTVRSQYGPVLFQDKYTNATGRGEYMSEMYPTVRDMGSYYIHRRNPKVSPSEEDGFLQALFTLASQESEWTHYRLGKDGIVRFMRGDSLHGYGLMQIDDRAHATQVKDGQAVDLAGNMLLGLDQFYSNWVKSAKVACVKSPADYQSRARAAWAAYNGGAGSFCRWTNSKSKWAANDRGFYAHYTSHNWLAPVHDKKAPAPLNVRCLAEGKRPCAAPRN